MTPPARGKWKLGQFAQAEAAEQRAGWPDTAKGAGVFNSRSGNEGDYAEAMLNFFRSNMTFLRHNGRWIAGGFLLTLFSSFGQTFFIGLFGNDLRSAFQLSGGEFGGI